ncbi:MAG: DUF5700 domain-containing putative Zn-dependent protease [Bacteroidota bacterium]|nr:DUF5700 domain-containing putative Zn-dependent protease [Bacteroidota bacterium]
MKILNSLLLAIILTNSVYSQTINTDAVNRFWTVVELLKSDKPLTDSLWNFYYSVQGNKVYMDNNRSEENVAAHRKYLEFLFKPSLTDSLKNIESNIKNFENDDIFQNLYFIKSNEQKLKEYSKEIQKPAYLETSIKLAKKYLPKNKYNKIPKNLTVYIMAMTYDAAVQDSSMYFGISCVYDLDRFQKGSVAAHELHHILRKNKEFKIKLSPRDSATVDIVDQVNNEGCADLIDKTVFIENAEKIAIGNAIKNWLISEADNTIKKIDSCFIVNSLSIKEFTNSKEFRKITNYSSGHIPGFYMVDIIKRNGYMSELISVNDNPFNFFYIYNKAAKKDKLKPSTFSQQTIEYLKKIESKLQM